MTPHTVIANGASLPLSQLPLLSFDRFSQELLAIMKDQGRIIAYFADLSKENKPELEVFAVLAAPNSEDLLLLRAKLPERFPSLTPNCPQLHLFEREIAEQYGVTPEAHPWFKPVRFQTVMEGRPDAWGRDPNLHPEAGDISFFKVEGEEIHEVAVGPVHAGVIEPGHFRFQCFGEKVLHLEISLGYQHRGIERLLLAGPHPATGFQMETIAGDTSIGHMTAYSQVLEALAGIQATPRAQSIRAIALELERLANHVGDLGALAGDVGFLPTASFCGRLRGDYLNMSAAICGSRFGRGLVRPGGVLFDIEPQVQEELRRKLLEVANHTKGAVDLFFDTPSVLGRLESVGVVPAKTAIELGLVGGGGRACGLDCDVRRQHPTGLYREDKHPEILQQGGDVYARAKVRQQEITTSIAFINRHLQQMPQGALSVPCPALPPSALAVSLVEGWRGRIAHVALTDEHGRFRRYKIVDPSFFNWSGLAMSLRHEQISDFPLCNKSFNLSYCGFDL